MIKQRNPGNRRKKNNTWPRTKRSARRSPDPGISRESVRQKKPGIPASRTTRSPDRTRSVIREEAYREGPSIQHALLLTRPAGYSGRQRSRIHDDGSPGITGKSGPSAKDSAILKQDGYRDRSPGSRHSAAKRIHDGTTPDLMQSLRPTVWVGKHGITSTILDEIGTQLKRRKVIKVKILANSDVNVHDLAKRAGAEVVSVRGRILVLRR